MFQKHKKTIIGLVIIAAIGVVVWKLKKKADNIQLAEKSTTGAKEEVA